MRFIIAALCIFHISPAWAAAERMPALITFTETFDVSRGHGHAGLLTVDVTYRGSEAERIRAEGDIREAGDDMFYDYSRCYDGIAMQAPHDISVAEDGAITITGHYVIADIWEQLASNAYRACFYNQNIKDYIDGSEDAARTKADGPIPQQHPVSVDKDVHISLPSEGMPYAIDDETKTIENAYFTLSYTRALNESQLVYLYRFRTLGTEVARADAKDFLADIVAAQDLTSVCDVRYRPDVTSVEGFVSGRFGPPLTAALVVFGFYCVWRALRTRFLVSSSPMITTEIEDFRYSIIIPAPRDVVWERIIAFRDVPYVYETMCVTPHGDEIAWTTAHAQIGAMVKYYGKMAFGLQRFTSVSRVTAMSHGCSVSSVADLQAPITGVDTYLTSAKETITLEALDNNTTRVTFCATHRVTCPAPFGITGKKLLRMLDRIYGGYGKNLSASVKRSLQSLS